MDLPMLEYNKNLKFQSRGLRKEMTDAERMLWIKIKKKQLNNLQFYRQKIIGDYIVDFYCPRAKIVIEVDGGQHYEEEGIKKDEIRDNYLKNLGFKVLRFTNLDVLKNIGGVMDEICRNCKIPPDPPLPKWGTSY